MLKRQRLLNREPEGLDDLYFKEIRPKLYELHAKHGQYGTRKGRTLAEHLDSACQFVLTVSKLAGVPEEKRGSILAATAVHDLNKLDKDERKVKTLARDRNFLREQLDRSGVGELVKTDEELELVRRLIESHSGHNNTDGMRFVAEDPQIKDQIKRWSAMLIGGDLFDLGIPEETRIRKVETELTVAFRRSSRLFKVTLSEDRSYLTSLLLSACEEVLHKHKLHTLAIEPDGQIFEGEAFPIEDLTVEIARQWQKKIDRVFSGNVEQLVKATKDGIKVDPQAIQQNPEATLDQVITELAKKFSGYKADKVTKDIEKYGNDAGKEAVAVAQTIALTPVATADEFAFSEGMKAAYLSYRAAELSPKDAWDRIATHIGLSPEQRTALEPFNAQYGRSLFAAKAVTGGMDSIRAALQDSFQLRQVEDTDVSEELISAVRRLLNFSRATDWKRFAELTAYIEANPRQRCSLGAMSAGVDELISNKMPPGTKVQAFSNRLPGGMSAEPKRRADTLASLAYQLITVGANFPKASKQDPLYLHFALPRGSNRELQAIWRKWLHDTAATNAEGGTVTIDELQLYRDNIIAFKSNKVVGFALPKRADFIHCTVTIPIVWGDVNSSVALLKSLRLALELALAPDFGFPFILSANLEVEPKWDVFSRVEGIPSALQPLLGSGSYQREGHLSQKERQSTLLAEQILERLQCIGKLAVSVASLQKKDDCLYDLARAAQRPLDIYHVLLRWILREQDDPNLEAIWNRISEPLTTLLRSFMSEEHELIKKYMLQAAKLAAQYNIRGSSYKRTAKTEPFSAFLQAVRSRKPHMSWDVVFAALTQEYRVRLARIIKQPQISQQREEQVKQYYQVLKLLFQEVYQERASRLVEDRKTLEAAYLFFFEEARKELKEQAKADIETEQE
ncbi:CRISPR-associated protein Csc3 [Argonema galeatum]|uniref:CRISPR-associated protein Csc3 n=1 Tax=Argonema galeatum TaxID=2942762 RepID=UPI0020121CA8|nr:CRISPR-associated protein Csc3 [Argonema galeatum]MCL1467497.1 CRISPR-associated protein Csc3 [Argonema galeatum A003/A1]